MKIFLIFGLLFLVNCLSGCSLGTMLFLLEPFDPDHYYLRTYTVNDTVKFSVGDREDRSDGKAMYTMVEMVGGFADWGVLLEREGDYVALGDLLVVERRQKVFTAGSKVVDLDVEMKRYAGLEREKIEILFGVIGRELRYDFVIEHGVIKGCVVNFMYVGLDNQFEREKYLGNPRGFGGQVYSLRRKELIDVPIREDDLIEYYEGRGVIGRDRVETTHNGGW